MLVDLQRVTGGGKVTVEIYWMDSWGREQSRKEILSNEIEISYYIPE